MVTVRTAKMKGSQHEYDCMDSLKPVYDDILITKQLGMVDQYDLISKEHKLVFECKRLHHFSWNLIKKYFLKLEALAPENHTCYLLFRANQNPCLVMRRLKLSGHLMVKEFEDHFRTPFIKHKGKKKDA